MHSFCRLECAVAISWGRGKLQEVTSSGKWRPQDCSSLCAEPGEHLESAGQMQCGKGSEEERCNPVCFLYHLLSVPYHLSRHVLTLGENASFKLKPVFSSQAKIKPSAQSTVAALCAAQWSDGCTRNVNKQCREQNFCIKKGVCYTSPPLPCLIAVFTQLCFVKCVGEAFIIIFLVIYLPKIAQHLFCGELLSQSFTVALTDAKGGHGPYSVILKPSVSST